MRRFPSVFAIILLVSALLPFPLARASERELCFPETGQCISGVFRDYWEQHGGLRTFGYPVSSAFVDEVEGSWRGAVQWFEHDRLEDHWAQGQGVLSGRLGATMLALQDRPWQELPQIARAPVGCRYFAQTRHSLCGAFLQTWLHEGGMQRFGYPLTEPMEETLVSGDTIWSGSVQYFERRRMELHSELTGTPYEVLFGLLGRVIFGFTKTLKCGHADSPLVALAGQKGFSCAVSLPRLRVPVALESFERGEMIWLSHPAGKPGTIYVIARDASSGALRWQSYLDQWREGAALPEQPVPPPGRVAPLRGFGLLWASNAEVRAALGWATAPEQGDRGDTQRFYVNSGANGLTIIASPVNQQAFLFYEGAFPPDRRDTAEIVTFGADQFSSGLHND